MRAASDAGGQRGRAPRGQEAHCRLLVSAPPRAVRSVPLSRLKMSKVLTHTPMRGWLPNRINGCERLEPTLGPRMYRNPCLLPRKRCTHSERRPHPLGGLPRPPKPKCPPCAQAQHLLPRLETPPPGSRTARPPRIAARDWPKGSAGSDWARRSHEGVILFRAVICLGLEFWEATGRPLPARWRLRAAAGSSRACSAGGRAWWPAGL